MAKARLKVRLTGLVLLASMLLSGCDAFSSEPTYGGLSIAGFNYTPYNLDRFVITDKYGNHAGGGGDLMPGSGEGSLSCCYQLKGTEFTVKWEVYDADEAIRSLRAREPIKSLHKSMQVHLPPTKVKSGRLLVLGLHFYPDDHVEFEFRTDLRGTRIFYGEIDEWLLKKQGKRFNNTMEDAMAFRRTARIASEGWTKYGFTDTQDLQQYVYHVLLVNPKFDEHPAVQKILAETKDKPGAFGAAMEALPIPSVDDLKRDRSKKTETNRSHG